MSWQYNQRTDILNRNGQIVGVGYSGRSAGRNNPSLEGMQNIGPIPQGRYRIGPQYTHPSKGPVTMALTPVGMRPEDERTFSFTAIASPIQAMLLRAA